MVNEQFDEEGNILTVGNYKFVDGTLGKGSFGTVRLAQLMEGPSTPLSTPIGRSQHVTQKRHSGDGSMTAMTPTKLDEKMNKVDMRTARKEARRKTASAPYGQDPFAEDKGKVVPTMAVGQLGLIVKHGLKKASDQLGSFFDEKPQADNLYAVKIFHKSLLKKMRTMERDKETRKMKVHTALEQVEREIALMKKMHHPNLVSLYEVIDSPESDILYMVIEFMPLGEIMTYQDDGTFRRSNSNVTGYNAKLGHFDEAAAALFFVDILHGLAYLHQHRVIHRDLKPENIL
jgi:serine/threonine protein kinase